MPKTIFDKVEPTDKSDADEIMDAIFEFEDEYSEYIPDVQTFGKRVNELMSKRKWNSKIFKDKTLLSDKDYSIYITNQTELPTLSKTFAICIGLNISRPIALELFLLAGHPLTHEKVERAHYFALKRFKGQIYLANDFIAKIKERESTAE